MVRIVAFIGIVLLVLASLQPARAATAVAFSADGDAYGWCADYASGAAPSCAVRQCSGNGGKQCEQVLSCYDGRGAIAFPEGAVDGFAAICGMKSANYARGEALAACIVASQAVCWTSSAFDANGNETSKDDNYSFDLTWYAQTLLQLDGVTKDSTDGVMGPATRTSLGKFQTSLGRTPTGIIDDETIRRLIDADEGVHHFARALKRDLIDPETADLKGNLYSYGQSPDADMTFSDEMMQRSDGDRLVALATMLTAQGDKCALPAKSATLVLREAETWSIECDEADYTLIVSADGGTMVMSEPNKPGGDTNKGSPADTQPDAKPTASSGDTSPAPGSSETTEPDSVGGRNLSTSHGH